MHVALGSHLHSSRTRIGDIKHRLRCSDMNLKTSPNYNLHQLRLQRVYKLRLQKVKDRIALITGKVPSIEIVILCLIDEFLSLHSDGDFNSPLVRIVY